MAGRAARDPLDELLDDLAARGKPSLPWLVRWSAGASDPVQSAWESSVEPGAMVAFAARCGRAEGVARVCGDANAWLPSMSGFRARAERDGAVRAFAEAAAALRAGRVSVARGEISRAIARWPVAREVACRALREAMRPRLEDVG